MHTKRGSCPYCGLVTNMANLLRHIRSHENGNYDQKNSGYHLDHEDLNCKYCGAEKKNRNSLIQHEIRCSKNPKRIPVTITGVNNKGHIAWNKGLTKYTDERVAKNGQAITNGYKSGKIQPLRGAQNPSSNPEVRKKISETIRQKARNGEWHTSLATKMHHHYNGYDFDGKWEVAFAVYLDLCNIPYVRNSDRFPYTYNNQSSTYTPDFYLPATDEYIEIKGYSCGRDYAKWKQFPSDKRLVILKEKDLLALGVFDDDIMQYVEDLCKFETMCDITLVID